MKHIKAPNSYPKNSFKVFLGGSIDMGSAENWQDRVAADLSSYDDDVIILNPRRDDWDSSWKQDPTPGTQFYEQVDWELTAQADSTILVYYFADSSASPITLLELGLFGTSFNTIVYCTPAFYRYGNVRMVCDRYGIPILETYETFIEAIKERI